jgi:hypothetical protein
VAFFLCPESEIRAGKLLVDPDHLQEELVRGRPQKSSPPPSCGSYIAGDHTRKYPEIIVSLK